jgi:predicted double-glycine peptidase
MPKTAVTRGSATGNLLDDLLARAPMIVPVRFHGYNHFVVVRGAAGNRVLLADPAFGNYTMLATKFERSWLE